MRYMGIVIFTLLTAVFFIAYQGVLSHVPYYHEQHHLFLFSKTYFTNTVHSDGLLKYITYFVVQFFYYPWLGSLILSLLLASVYALIAYSSRRLSGASDYFCLSILPVAYLFIQMLTVDFPINSLVGFFIVLSLMSLVFSLPEKWWRYVICLCILALLAFFLSWKIVAISVVVVLLSALSGFLMRKIKQKYGLLMTIGVVMVYGRVVFDRFYHSYNIGERRMIQAQKSVREKDWAEAYRITDHYLKSGRNNQLMSYYRNIALYHLGGLNDHLFDIPQIYGMKSLYFPWQSNSRETEHGQVVYEELGYWNEAHRWAFEAMTVWGETAPILTDLAKYNIKMERYAVAQHFINLLKQSSFYKKRATELEREIQAESVVTEHIFGNEHARFSNILNIVPELEYLCNMYPDNRMAHEYYMNALLLSNQVVRFAQNLYRMKVFDYEKLPDTFEEALFLYKIGNEEAFEALNITLSGLAERRFEYYYQLYGQMDMERLKAEFGNSYWYYVHFVSPYGNKIISPETYTEPENPGGRLKH